MTGMKTHSESELSVF